MKVKEVEIVYDKKNGVYTEVRVIEDVEKIYRDLARMLVHKKLHSCKWIKRITDRTNYDGTRTIDIYEDNGIRRRFIVED